MMREQEVRLEPQELPGQVPFAADHLLHRDRRVVVTRPGRDPAEERERGDMRGLECLGAFARICRQVPRIRKRQRHHRERRLGPFAGDHDRCFTEIELRFARRMAERHENFSAMPLRLRDVTADLNLAAPIVVLVTQPVEDPPSRVSLLRRRVPIRRQHLVDQPDKRPQHGLRPRPPEPISRRLRMLENLLQRLPAHLVLTTDLALRDPSTSTLRRISDHSSISVRTLLRPARRTLPRKPQGAQTSRRGPSGAAVFDDHKPITGAVVFEERLQACRRCR